MYETHSPVEDRFSFSSKGIFYCSKPTERISIIVIVVSAVLIAVLWYNVLFEQLKWYFVNDGTAVGVDTARTIGYVYVFSMAFLFVIVCIIIKYILHGSKYYYSADAKHFSFRSEKAHVPKTDIFYDDVVSVKFEEHILFGHWLRGYIVSITTRSLGIIRFEYLFNKSISEKTPRNTPFRIIEERVAMLTENDAANGR